MRTNTIMSTGKIVDKETEVLTAISSSLQGEYFDTAESRWSGSPFAWIRQKPSRQRGKIGEQLIAGWCAARDLDVSRSPDSEADRVIEGRRIEIKFSMLWAGGNYVFQQIRNQHYDYLLCLGVSPFSAHAWLMQKSEIPFAEMRHQHGGSRGRDTWWLSVAPEHVPQWLRPFGGSLAQILGTLKSLRK